MLEALSVPSRLLKTTLASSNWRHTVACMTYTLPCMCLIMVNETIDCVMWDMDGPIPVHEGVLAEGVSPSQIMAEVKQQHLDNVWLVMFFKKVDGVKTGVEAYRRSLETGRWRKEGKNSLSNR